MILLRLDICCTVVVTVSHTHTDTHTHTLCGVTVWFDDLHGGALSHMGVVKSLKFIQRRQN